MTPRNAHQRRWPWLTSIVRSPCGDCGPRRPHRRSRTRERPAPRPRTGSPSRNWTSPGPSGHRRAAFLAGTGRGHSPGLSSSQEPPRQLRRRSRRRNPARQGQRVITRHGQSARRRSGGHCVGGVAASAAGARRPQPRQCVVVVASRRWCGGGRRRRRRGPTLLRRRAAGPRRGRPSPWPGWPGRPQGLDVRLPLGPHREPDELGQRQRLVGREAVRGHDQVALHHQVVVVGGGVGGWR